MKEFSVNTSLSKYQFSRLDWRWVVVGYCSLILLQLFPSYFIFGLRRAPLTNMSGIFMLWMGIGVAIVSGFVGSASNPTEIIVVDPLYGERYYTASSFEANWSTLGKAGVVVE